MFVGAGPRARPYEPTEHGLPRKQNKPKRLLVISSPDKKGDADGPPSIDSARSGALGNVRSLLDEGSWPEGLDVLIVSDSYGLVEPGADEEPVPIPFARIENPDWWAGFIS